MRPRSQAKDPTLPNALDAIDLGPAVESPSSRRSPVLNAAAEKPGDYVGTMVTATWGEEAFSPVQYNTFRVGPFSATTTVRVGETFAQAFARLNASLAEVADQARRDKAREFLRSLREVGEEAKR